MPELHTIPLEDAEIPAIRSVKVHLPADPKVWYDKNRPDPKSPVDQTEMNMTNVAVTAIYERGILRLLHPLALPEQTQVRVYIEPESPAALVADHRRRVREALTAAGLSLPAPPPAALSTLTRERRAELARRFAAGGPLADLIIAEREER